MDSLGLVRAPDGGHYFVAMVQVAPVQEPEYAEVAGIRLPAKPWPDGETTVGRDQWLLNLPQWSPPLGECYVSRYGVGAVSGPGAVDHLLGGLLDIGSSEWGSDEGYTLFAWRGDDLVGGATAAPWFAVGPDTGTPSGLVGDVTGGGLDDYAVGSGFDLYLFAGEEPIPDEGGGPFAVIHGVPDPGGHYRLDPQPGADLDGDGTSDLLVGLTAALYGTSWEWWEEPAQVLVYSGGAGLRGERSYESPDWKFEPLPVFEGSNPHGAVVTRAADVDGDGAADLVVSIGLDPQPRPDYPQYSDASSTGPAARVFFNPGVWPAESTSDDSIVLRFPGPTSSGPGSGLLVEDLDADGLRDVVMPLSMGRIVDWMGTGTDVMSAAVWSGRAIASTSPGSELWPSVLLGTRDFWGELGSGAGGEAGTYVSWDGEYVLLALGCPGNTLEAGKVQAIPADALIPYL